MSIPVLATRSPVAFIGSWSADGLEHRNEGPVKRWKVKPCGCVKTELERFGRVHIRCERHRDKPAKGGRTLCHFNEDGMVCKS